MKENDYVDNTCVSVHASSTTFKRCPKVFLVKENEIMIYSADCSFGTDNTNSVECKQAAARMSGISRLKEENGTRRRNNEDAMDCVLYINYAYWINCELYPTNEHGKESKDGKSCRLSSYRTDSTDCAADAYGTEDPDTRNRVNEAYHSDGRDSTICKNGAVEANFSDVTDNMI